MFDPKVIGYLAQTYAAPFRGLAQIEQELNARFANQTQAVRALMLAAAGGEPLLLIGPPGTGKSRLIRAFCNLLGLLDDDNHAGDHPDYFEYLLTPFTEPSELFGYYDIPQAMQGALVRLEEGMMQNARVVYLDEVFNGSSAILNAILAFLNERVFHDRGARRRVRLECLFAATNHTPDAPELRAVFDRFILRCRVHNVEADSVAISDLLRKGWRETFRSQSRKEAGGDILHQLHQFRKDVKRITGSGHLQPREDDPLYQRLAQMVMHVRQYGLSGMSNRRLVKLSFLMLVHRVFLSAVPAQIPKQIQLKEEDLSLLPRYFLDGDDPEVVAKLSRPAVMGGHGLL